VTAYAVRLVPALEQRLATLDAELLELWRRHEVASSGRDPLHSPRLVPLIAGQIRDVTRDRDAVKRRLDEIKEFGWLDEPA